MVVGKYYMVKDGSVSCTLCPHNCIIREGETGFCMVRKNVGQELVTLNYGCVSSLAIDPIEKKPLYHFQSGSSIMSVGSLGCNFSCQFCQNYSISREIDFSACQNYSPERLIDLTLEKGLKSIAFTYNEPTVFYEMVMDTAKLAKENELSTVLVTNGYINREPFLELAPFIDAMNIDVKSYDDSLYYELCHGHLKPVLNTVALAISEGIHVELTCLIVPTLFKDLNLCDEFFKLLKDTGGDVVVHLSRYFPRYKYNEPATDINKMIEIQSLAKKYFSYVYLGNI